MASQLFVDLYDCDAAVLDDLDRVKMIAREAIRDIQAEIVEECVHKFEPIGITYIAVITTSHFSIHTWPEHNYAAIDIFSCSEQVPEQIAYQLEKAFGAGRRVVREFERKIM